MYSFGSFNCAKSSIPICCLLLYNYSVIEVTLSMRCRKGSASPERSEQWKGCAEVLKAPIAGQLGLGLTLQFARGETSQRGGARGLGQRQGCGSGSGKSSRRNPRGPAAESLLKALVSKQGDLARSATSLGAAWSLWLEDTRGMIDCGR